MIGFLRDNWVRLVIGVAFVVAYKLGFNSGREAGISKAPEIAAARRDADKRLEAEFEKDRVHEAKMLKRYGCTTELLVEGMTQDEVLGLLGIYDNYFPGGGEHDPRP